MTQPDLSCSNPPHWRLAVIGAGPEGFAKDGRCFTKINNVCNLGCISEMDNKGVKAGASLGFKNSGNRFVVGGVRSQAVNGFGGKGDPLAIPDHRGGAGDVPGTGAQNYVVALGHFDLIKDGFCRFRFPGYLNDIVRLWNFIVKT